MIEKSGKNDWKHAHEVLNSRENSADHLQCQKNAGNIITIAE